MIYRWETKGYLFTYRSSSFFNHSDETTILPPPAPQEEGQAELLSTPTVSTINCSVVSIQQELPLSQEAC